MAGERAGGRRRAGGRWLGVQQGMGMRPRVDCGPSHGLNSLRHITRASTAPASTTACANSGECFATVRSTYAAAFFEALRSRRAQEHCVGLCSWRFRVKGWHIVDERGNMKSNE